MINVLIVEDDPMVGELNKRYLTQIDGFELKGIATSFQQALDILKTEAIHLVLLDIYMPGQNGLAYYQKFANKIIRLMSLSFQLPMKST